jgi:hypothetical protein
VHIIDDETTIKSFCGYVFIEVEAEKSWFDFIEHLVGKKTKNGCIIKRVIKITVADVEVKYSDVRPDEIDTIVTFVVFGVFCVIYK